jgi:hypothetical protein
MHITAAIYFSIVTTQCGAACSKALTRALLLQWDILDATTIHKPLRLLAIMVFGPRWNTHAVVGSTHSFTLAAKGTSKLQIRVDTANMSAKAW